MAAIEPGRILVTGFASTAKGLNASDVLVRSLIDNLPAPLREAKSQLHFRIIDTTPHDLRDALDALLAEIEPAICVFVGQAPGRNAITLERVAANLKFTGPPPSPGDTPPSAPIDAHGPASCVATLTQMDAMIEKLRDAGIPAALSDDAGNHLCNQLLYEGLQHATQARCGFVHIPALPQQVIERWPSYPFMPLEMMRAAMEIILLAQRRLITNLY